jgi:hypothetical protein
VEAVEVMDTIVIQLVDQVVVMVVMAVELLELQLYHHYLRV